MLTGCTFDAPSAPEHSQPTTSSSALPSDGPLSPAAEADAGPCGKAVQPVEITDPADPEQLGGASLAIPFDRGPIPHATGDAVLDSGGVPVAYTVAPGDVWDTIQSRFCLSEPWLRWVNYVRRHSETVFAGDTLNLDAHTIMSVGDENGVVYDNALPDGFRIPPQR